MVAWHPISAAVLGTVLVLSNAGLSTAWNHPVQPLRLRVPSRVPHDASDEVDLDFAGLAFEQSSWVRYAEDDDGNTNAFTRNLMDSIYSRTGGKPIIRLGGTSPDYAKYLPGQEEPALPVAEQDNYQDVGHTTIGPSYWKIAHRFPDAKYMIQVPLATTNVSETVAWARAAVDEIGLANVHSLQIGNEPNAYGDDYTGEGGIFLGPPDWQGTLNNETYVGNYTHYAAAIRDAIDLPDHFFTAFDVGAQVNTPEAARWLIDVPTAFRLGIDQDNIIKEVAHHYYQNQAGQAEDLEAGLMTMELTHTNLDYHKVRINYLRQNRPDVPFIMNEIGNSLQPKNIYKYQARLGSALWAVDFYLYALTIGVRRFNYQQIMHSGFDLWLPVASAGLPAQVFANYYSHPFLADFVGPSGKTRVSKIEVSDADSVPNLAAYVAYDDGKPKRIAIANLDYWNKTSSDTERPFARIKMSLPWKTRSIRVSHLTSPDGAGAGAESITYGGSQWTYESMGQEVPGVEHDNEKLYTLLGNIEIRVPSSEAVMISLDA